MEQSTHDVRRANWLNIVKQCQNRPSDMSVKQWLEENDIKEKAYYYYLKNTTSTPVQRTGRNVFF